MNDGETSELLAITFDLKTLLLLFALSYGYSRGLNVIDRVQEHSPTAHMTGVVTLHVELEVRPLGPTEPSCSQTTMAELPDLPFEIWMEVFSLAISRPHLPDTSTLTLSQYEEWRMGMVSGFPAS